VQQESDVRPGKTRQLQDEFEKPVRARREFYLYATGADGRVIHQGDPNSNRKDKTFTLPDGRAIPFKYYLFEGQPQAFGVPVSCDTASRN
jgi:hypothetical protein